MQPQRAIFKKIYLGSCVLQNKQDFQKTRTAAKALLDATSYLLPHMPLIHTKARQIQIFFGKWPQEGGSRVILEEPPAVDAHAAEPTSSAAGAWSNR